METKGQRSMVWESLHSGLQDWRFGASVTSYCDASSYKLLRITRDWWFPVRCDTICPVHLCIFVLQSWKHLASTDREGQLRNYRILQAGNWLRNINFRIKVAFDQVWMCLGTNFFTKLRFLQAWRCSLLWHHHSMIDKLLLARPQPGQTPRQSAPWKRSSMRKLVSSDFRELLLSLHVVEYTLKVELINVG